MSWNFPTRRGLWLCFFILLTRHQYPNSVASGKGSKNSQLDKTSGGGTPETRFVSSFVLSFFVSSGTPTRGPSRAEGDAPRITSRVNGKDLVGCKQNSIHWWIIGDGPRTRPPSCSASLPETVGIAFENNVLHGLTSIYVLWSTMSTITSPTPSVCCKIYNECHTNKKLSGKVHIKL